MACPEAGKWFEVIGNKPIGDVTEQKFPLEYKTKGFYYCAYKEGQKYYFYVQGKGELKKSHNFSSFAIRDSCPHRPIACSTAVL